MPVQLRPATDDGLVRAVEMVLTPLLFAAAGFGLDVWLGTRPWFTVALGVLAFVGKSLTEWYRYVARMKAHQAALAAQRTDAPRDLRADDSPDANQLSVPDGLPAGVSLNDPTDEQPEHSLDAPSDLAAEPIARQTNPQPTQPADAT